MGRHVNCLAGPPIGVNPRQVASRLVGSCYRLAYSVAGEKCPFVVFFARGKELKMLGIQFPAIWAGIGVEAAELIPRFPLRFLLEQSQ